MPRQYTVSFSQVAVSAAEDLFQITGGAGRTLRVTRAVVGATDTSLPTAQMLSFEAAFLPATVTPGSGGTSPTAAKADPGDGAPAFTAYANNTTPASTSGSQVKLYEEGVHIYNGLDRDFGDPVIGPGEAFVLRLLSTPSGTVHLSGTLWVEESGG